MLGYRYRNTFLQNLHPLTNILIILNYIIIFLVVKNPIYILISLASLMLLSNMDCSLRDVLSYGKMIIPFAVLIMIFNPILVHDGNTIFYTTNIKFPIIGEFKITFEALIYGIVNGIRIICITMAFGFGNLIIHPDKSFGFFSKYLKKSTLLMSMTVRFFPSLIKSYSNISEIEILRGNNIHDKNLKKKIKNYGNIVNILFLSSIEDAGDIAESMCSRGYGCKKRSSYFNERFSKWDSILIILIVAIFIYLQLLNNKGLNIFNIYPTVDNPLTCTSIYGYSLCGTLFILALVNWGWKAWK